MKAKTPINLARCPTCGMVVSVGSIHWHTGPIEAKPIKVVAVDGRGEPDTASAKKDEP